VSQLVACGLRVGATADDAGVEAVELPDHPFFLVTLFQPQVGASAGRPIHPVIDGLISAMRAGEPSARA
jgi:CTP synthase (UTP-ammonia lyase)